MEKQIKDEHLFRRSIELGNWACDCGIDEDDNLIMQSNGGREHLIWVDGKYYTAVTDANEEKLYPGTLNEVIPEDLEGEDFISKMIDGWKTKWQYVNLKKENEKEIKTNNRQECEVHIEFVGMSQKQMNHIRKATLELFEAGISFDTGGCKGKEGFDYDWEFDYSLEGAKVYFVGMKEAEL